MKLQDLEKVKESHSDMKHAIMLYKQPGPYKMGKDGMFDYCVVDKCDEISFNMLLKAEWKFTIQGAKKADSAVEKAVVSKLKCEKAIVDEAKAEEATAEEPKALESTIEEPVSKDPDKIEADKLIKDAKSKRNR